MPDSLDEPLVFKLSREKFKEFNSYTVQKTKFLHVLKIRINIKGMFRRPLNSLISARCTKILNYMLSVIKCLKVHIEIK